MTIVLVGPNKLVVDARNAMQGVIGSLRKKIIKA